MSQHSTTIRPESGAAYAVARSRAALIDRSARGRIVVSGVDRASYLQGLLTNDIAALRPGQGCYAAYLTAQGRMIADMLVYELDDVMLMTTSRDVKDTVLARLDQFVFTEDVKLGDVTDSFAQLAIVGPDAARHAAALLGGVSESSLASMVDHGNARADFRGSPAIVTRITDPGEPGFDLFIEATHETAARSALADAGVPALDEATADVLRIEAGIPVFHRDMDEETIPLEAGIESRAISFTKGCYVGQEVIVRVLHRGHGRVARKLVGLRFDGEDVPAAGAAVHSGDREIGAITSVAWSPALQRPIALAYVHRDFVAPGTEVAAGAVRGEVAALPFVAGA